jgi:hypothetical protein
METQNPEKAKTILNQIGHKVLYMIGAKNILRIENGIQFKIMRNSKGVNMIKIVYNAGKDLYTMSFLNIRKKQFEFIVKTISEFDEVYFDQMNDLIETETGLYTSL